MTKPTLRQRLGAWIAGAAPKTRTRASGWGSSSGVGYRAAENNRLVRDWVYRYASTDQEMLYDLLQLRARSRELVRNSAWGANYVRVVRNNAIGPRGIRLQAQVKNADGVLKEDVNSMIEAAWDDWGRRGTCTVDGKLSWLGVQQLVGAMLPMDGEVLVRLVRGFDNKYGFALQLLDPDQLDQFLSIPAAKGRNEIRGGVEINEWGRPVFYHIWKGHPADPYQSREREVVPADQIIHVYDPYRVAQSRGVPWFASVMTNVNMLRGYNEAELVAARVAAAKGGFFERAAEDDGPGISIEEGQGTLSLDAEPGVFEELPAGLTFKPFSPEHPTTAYSDFNRAQLRAIAAGGGVSATSLSKDLADVNYSSIRAGLLDERDEARRVQQLLIEQLHDRVYREFVRMGRLMGAFDSRLSTATFQTVLWRPRGWTWVDPRNDAEAAVLDIRNGMDSRTRIMSEQGLDFAEIAAELSAEEKLAESLGLSITGPEATPAKQADDPTGGDGNGNGNGNGNGKGRPGKKPGAHRISMEDL